MRRDATSNCTSELSCIARGPDWVDWESPAQKETREEELRRALLKHITYSALEGGAYAAAVLLYAGTNIGSGEDIGCAVGILEEMAFISALYLEETHPALAARLGSLSDSVRGCVKRLRRR
jgi:hypothetical protein